jgi:YVTN family beta-propeller protein
VDLQLLLLDTAIDEIVGSVHLEGHTKGAQIARYSPDGKSCVVTSYPAPFATIFNRDLSIGRLVRIGDGPMNMAFHTDGRTVLFANQDEGTIAVVDMEEAEVLRTIKVGGGPETLSFF